MIATLIVFWIGVVVGCWVMDARWRRQHEPHRVSEDAIRIAIRDEWNSDFRR